ncbi:MAG TPA: tail fiber protein [Polyangiaceae bacterium]|nr:tail fiber protein [Polyangiaceae bacterium]
MSDPLIGEIRLFPFPQPPPGWLRCDGQLLTRTQHTELFRVLGTRYGGDEHTTFALPNLQGRVALHPGGGVSLGARGGEETHSLTLAEMPNHTHLLSASKMATSNTAQHHFWGSLPGAYSSGNDEPDAAFGSSALAAVGDGEPHTNLQPYLVANYCIAITGAPPHPEGDVARATDGLIGEVRLFAGEQAPRGWVTCDGQLLSTRDHTPLYAILGTIYGGDGQSTFALPDLRGRVPLHEGQGSGLTPRALAESGGAAQVMLAQSELPMHSHIARCATGSDQSDPEGALWSNSGQRENAFAPVTDNTLMSPRSVEFVGGNAAHDNMQPYLGLHYILALDGTFPAPV